MAHSVLLIISAMKKLIFIMSLAAAMLAMSSCRNNADKAAKEMLDEPYRQEKEFLGKAIKYRSPDVQKVDVIGNTVIYTHIFDGIIDVKAYTYDGDTCVEAERVYTFPDQMSALRHYRNAVEQAELYDNIQLFNNEVKYDLKAAQHELETKGLNKEQLKEKFDRQIANAKADVKAHNKKFKEEMKRHMKDLDKKSDCCDAKSKDK